MNIKDFLGDSFKEGMSFEEINQILSDTDIPENNNDELDRLKNALSKSNSEAANYKKQLRDKLSEEEIKSQKEKEEREELENKYKALLKETSIAKNKNNYLTLGYDEKLADDTARAIVEGNFEKVFSNQFKHQENLIKKIKADMLKETPVPVGDSNNGSIMTLEKFRKLSQAQRYEFSINHPQEYANLYGKE